MVEWLFLAVLWGFLRFVIVVFLYSYTLTILDMGYPRIIPMKLCDSPPGSSGAVIKSSLLTGG